MATLFLRANRKGKRVTKLTVTPFGRLLRVDRYHQRVAQKHYHLNKLVEITESHIELLCGAATNRQTCGAPEAVRQLY